jgi:hypothetical protein
MTIAESRVVPRFLAYTLPCPLHLVLCTSAARHVCSSSSTNGNFPAAAVGCMMQSYPAGNQSLFRRYISRSRRFRRLRATALPTARGKRNATRRVGRSDAAGLSVGESGFGAQRRLRNRVPVFSPNRFTRATSRRRRRISARVRDSTIHTLRRLRPFARRRLMTLRPPGVCIRARNP